VFDTEGVSSSVADLLARLPGGSVAPASAGAGQVLPVLAPLRPLLPAGGLRRGITVEVGVGSLVRPQSVSQSVSVSQSAAAGGPVEEVASGGSALLLALVAGPSQAGSWCALVGAPGVGVAAASEAGVDLAHLALVPTPGAGWARVVAALVEGFDLVAVRPPAGASAADRRTLTARARHHGAVLLSLGSWPGAEVRLSATSSVWEGLGAGHGRLRARRVVVRAGGRGAAGGRPRAVELWLPAAGAPLASAAPVTAGRVVPDDEGASRSA
jgi:hypothetical protein